MTPKSSSLTLMLRSAVARIVPSSIGTSYVLPVRLSVIVRESAAVATPPPLSGCSSVPIALLWRGRDKSLPPIVAGGEFEASLPRDDGGEHRRRDQQDGEEHQPALDPGRRREGGVLTDADERQDEGPGDQDGGGD